MRPALRLALALAAGCGEPCPLEEAAPLPAGAVDCGDLAGDKVTTADAQRLRDCVLGAAGRGAPFRALWDAEGTDSIVRGGLVREAPDGPVRRLISDRSAGLDIPRHARVQRFASEAFGPQGDCRVGPKDPCLTCTGATGVETLCETR